MLSNHVGCGSSKWNIDKVVVEKLQKKTCQTYIQTNLQTHKRSNINGFRHLIKYGVIFNFF